MYKVYFTFWRFDAFLRFFLKSMDHPQVFSNLDSINNSESIPTVTQDNFHNTAIEAL